MEKITKTSVKISILILLLAIVNYVITTTYSKYKNTSDGGNIYDVAAWHIVVNNDDISKTGTFQKIVPFVIDNPEVDPDYIGPGTTGYFDLDINYSGTQVPFTYSTKICDPNVDYSSSYTLDQTTLDYENQYGTYRAHYNLDFNYSYLKTPVWYWDNYGQRYCFNGREYVNATNASNSDGMIPIVLEFPESLRGIYYIENTDYDFTPGDKFLTLYCAWFNFKSDNNAPTIYISADHQTISTVPFDGYVYTSNGYSNNHYVCQLQLDFWENVGNNNVFDSLVVNDKILVQDTFADYQIYAYSVNDEIENRQYHLINPMSNPNHLYTPITTDVGVYDKNTGFIGQLINPTKYVTYYNNHKKANENAITATYPTDNLRFRLYVIWNDAPDNVLDDEEDTAIGYESATIEQSHISLAYELLFNQIGQNNDIGEGNSILNVTNTTGNTTSGGPTTPTIPLEQQIVITKGEQTSRKDGDSNVITTNLQIAATTASSIRASRIIITTDNPNLYTWWTSLNFNGTGFQVTVDGNKLIINGGCILLQRDVVYNLTLENIRSNNSTGFNITGVTYEPYTNFAPIN